MDVISFAVKLYDRFIDIDPNELSRIESDARKWSLEHENHKIWSQVLKYQNIWFVKLLIGLLFVISIKQIGHWITRPYQDDHEEDEGMTDDIDMSEFQAFLAHKKNSSAFKKY